MLFVTITDITAQTDCTKTEKLPEVVVTADGQIEMSNKALLIPTQLEKKHSTNGFNLLLSDKNSKSRFWLCNLL